MKKRIEAILAAPSANGAAEDIVALITERIREERLVMAHYPCPSCSGGPNVPVVLDMGSSNWCQAEGKCPHCGAGHSVQFVRSIEAKFIHEKNRPPEINGRLF